MSDDIIIDDGEPVDTGDASTSDPVDQEPVVDPGDDGNRPIIDWDEDPIEGDANAQQTFTSQPVPPYRPGDLWQDGTAWSICVNGKASGQSFAATDWEPFEAVEPTPTTSTRTVTYVEAITDYSAAKLAEYEARGAVAYAVYDDGTRQQVAWSAVSEPQTTAPSVIADEALIIAQATNQHFWHRSTDPDSDGAGTGAFVTDEEQDDFLSAIASGTAPTTARPLHNLLLNAEGILIRAATRIRAAFTPSGVAFYDGQGNQSGNILASFGADGAQMGVADAAHIEIDESSVKMYGEEGTEILSIAAGGGFDWGAATASISNNDKIAIENGNSSFSIQKTSGMGLLSVYASTKVQYDDSAVVGEVIARAYEEYNTLVARGFDNVSLYDSGNVVFAGDVEDGTGNVLSGKQDALTAGSNITISGTTISATDTTDYMELSNKPSIESVELSGDKTFPQLGIFIDADADPVGGAPASDDYALTTTEITSLWNAAG